MSNQNNFNGQEHDEGVPNGKEGMNIWNKLVNSSVDNEDAYLSRLLNGILLILLGFGIYVVPEYHIRNPQDDASNIISIITLLLLALAYLLNRRKRFKAAVLLSVGGLIHAIFVMYWLNRYETGAANILFYLLLPLLLAELFLPTTSYATVAGIVFLCMFFFNRSDPKLTDIFIFTMIFSAMIGLTGYYRQKLEAARGEKLLSIERRHARQMELLNSITHAALQMPDTQQALQVLADRLSQLLEADGAFITLWDESRQQVIPATASGEFIDTYKDMVIQPGETTLTASALREKRTLPIEDVRNTPYMDPRFAADVPSQSALALPLIAHDQKLGAALISFNQRHQFTAAEIALGEQAAAQIALALLKIQSIETERRNARQMELLNSITQASLNTESFPEMLQVLADRMGEVLNADGAFITLWDEEQNRALPAAASGSYKQVYSNLKFDPDERSLTMSVLEVGHPLIIEDVMNSPHMSRSIAERFSSRSILALPLTIKEMKLGAALIAFDQIHRFTQMEVEIGERAAAQIALAIYKAHLIDVSLRQVNQLELLSEVGRDIANTLDENEILDRTLEAVVKKFGYAEAAISLLVDEDNLEVAAINGTEDFGYRPGFRQKTGQGIIGHVAETRTPHVTADVSQDPYYFSTAERYGSALGVPMLDKEKLLGVIYVESSRQKDFKSNDVQTLQTLANHVANSIQKARLYAHTQGHLQAMTTLQSVSQVVSSSLERDEILQNVVELLQVTFGYTHVSIYLLQENELHLEAQVGYSEDTIIYDIPITSGISGRTVLTKQTQFLPDVSLDPSFLRASQEVKSEICVPLIKNDVVFGTLNVESTSEKPLDDNDLNLLSAIAGSITIAIENARLHAQVKTMAITDAVSGLYNRHAFEDLLTTEIKRATRYGHQLSLIIFDVDSFKEYNDTWGHPAGDDRLKATADLIRASQRKYDIAARYGGDEFAIILPNTDKIGAYQFTKRLLDAARNSTTEQPMEGKGVPGYTLSMGFATFPQDGDTLESLLQAADQAELQAKRMGKNQIVAAGKPKGP